MSGPDTDTRLAIPQVPGSYYDLLTKARKLQDQRRWEEAASICERVVERLSRLPEHRRRPDTTQARLLIAAAADLSDIRARQRNYDAAIDLCKQLQAWDSGAVDFWIREVHVLQIEQGDVEKGLTGLQELAEGAPDNAGHWLALSREAAHLKRLDLVVEAVANLERLAPSMEDAGTPASYHLARFDSYTLQDRWPEAVQAWETAVSRDDSVNDSREMVVHMLLEADRLDEAMGLLDDESMGEPIATYYRAYIAHRRGDSVRARYLWRQVAETDMDEHPEAALAIALALCWLGQALSALGMLLDQVRVSKEMTPRKALVLALAWAMVDNLEAAQTNLYLATGQDRPDEREQRLSPLDWYPFEVLVKNTAIREALKTYFDPGIQVRAETEPSH